MGHSRAIAIAVMLFAAAPAFGQQRVQAFVNEAFVEKLQTLDDAIWWRADNRVGAKAINDTGFSANNIAIENGEMTLTLTGAPYRDRAHTGASYKSRGLYHYGQYRAVMKASRGAGIISAFYTYTGPVFGSPHDEIDFEFLGRNPRLVHLNYFVNGEAKLRRTIDLGFDASADFHLYEITWKKGEIIWRVDGRMVHQVSAAASEAPRNPGKIIAEIWAAKNLKRWAGSLDRSALPARAYVRCLSFTPQGETAPGCERRSKGGGS